MSEVKYVVFNLGKERYALPIESVERILDEMPIMPVPRSPKELLGVFDMRGETVPTMDLRRRFDMPERTDAGNLVVIEAAGTRCAIRVDRVDGIVAMEEEALEPQPPAMANGKDEFVLGILKHESGLVLVLRPEEILPTNVKKKVIQMEKQCA